MAYGGSYAAEVDVDRLRATGFPVGVINGVIVVRATETLSDVVDDFATLSGRRAEKKTLFQEGLSWIRVEPPQA